MRMKQKAIILNIDRDEEDRLNRYLDDGWTVVKTAEYHPTNATPTGNAGRILVIIEKENLS